MRFETPAPGITFDIPEEWWRFADMACFTPASEFYPPNESPSEALALAEVQPPARFDGVPLFKKYKLVPVFAPDALDLAVDPVVYRARRLSPRSRAA
jgi:hypothetical protein